MGSLKREFIGANRIDLERKMLPSLSLVTIAVAFVGFFVNFLIGLDIQIGIITISMIIAYGITYLLAKKEKFKLSKWTLFLVTLFAFNFYWHFNYGSRGPALYIFVIIYSFCVFLFDRTESIILGIIVVSNLTVLFLLEYHNPLIVGKYTSDKARVLDVYTTLVYYGLIFYVFMSMAREAYFSEYKKAKRADQLKSSFLANMSHEIRTPLNAIVGFSNILADENLTAEEKKQYSTIINGSNDSLLRLVNDILDVSMVESDQLNLRINSCDISKLLDNLEKTYLLKLKNEGRDIKLVNQKQEWHVFISTDYTRLQQVLVNLLDNALKYTEQGEIEFGFTIEEKEIKFYVKDTGIGIKDAHIKYLFDRFYKIEDDNSKLFRGTGIGLYLSKKLVNMLGGKIWVNSDFGKGSAFYFTIPKVDFHAETNGALSSKHHDYLSNTERRIKIMIIEDQESNQEYYSALLKQGNFELIQAYNGNEGIKTFEKYPEIDLILLDLKMPDIDGFEVLKNIRKKDTKIPIIAQTAYAMSADRERCLEAGFNDYIAKPVQRDALYQLIEKYTSRA